MIGKFSNLFKDIRIGNMVVKNRFVMPAMVTNFCTPEGAVTDRLIAYLQARAKGDVGLIITEAAFVHSSGKGFSRELGIHSDDLIPGLKKLTEAIHNENGKIAVQLHHSGRQTYTAVTSLPLIAPSPIPCPLCKGVPKEMTKQDIQQLIDAYGEGARRAKESGFDAVEIHGGHGYLLNQFLSPYSNKRADEYGGSLANRANVPLAVVSKVREVVGNEFPILYRISADELVPGGLTIDETTLFAQMLVKNGVDAINVSGSVYESVDSMMSSSTPQGVHMNNASAIRKAIKKKVPVIVVGHFRDPTMMEFCIAEEKADMVAIGRGLLADEALVAKIKAGDLTNIRKCIVCNQGCVGRLGADEDIRCLGNAATGREWKYDLNRKASERKKVLVVGGGPGGMEAARVAALRGHDVVLYEKERKLGGLLNYAILSPLKKQFEDLRKYQINQLEILGVGVKLGSAVDGNVIAQLQPDIVIVATGSHPIIPNIPGLHQKNAKMAEEILSGAEFGQNVVVIGGGAVGCETAEFMAKQGARVTVVEMLSKIAKGMDRPNRRLLMQRLKEKNVLLSVETLLREVKPDGELLLEKESQQKIMKGVDTIVLAVGYKPLTDVDEVLQKKHVPYIKIGDCREVRQVIDAVAEGFQTAYELC